MNEKLIKPDWEPQAKFLVFCATCRKTLYDPALDNPITRDIGMSAAVDHKAAFTAPHKVYVVELGKQTLL